MQVPSYFTHHAVHVVGELYCRVYDYNNFITKIQFWPYKSGPAPASTTAGFPARTPTRHKPPLCRSQAFFRKHHVIEKMRPNRKKPLLSACSGSQTRKANNHVRLTSCVVRQRCVFRRAKLGHAAQCGEPRDGEINSIGLDTVQSS